MIFKIFELNKVNLDKNNLFLFYGENNGHKNEIIAEKFEKNFKKQIYKYEEKEILDKESNFFNTILTKSFFEDKKLIIISRATDKITKIVEEILLKNVQDVTFVLLAGILEKKSKLRNFFEKKKDIICVPFYADKDQTLSNICINFFKEKKILISRENINLLIERCRNDRENLNNELRKIENYSKYDNKISTEDLLKLTNLSENYNVSELADSCLAKNLKKTTKIINENNFSIDDCILITRTLLMKAKRLLNLLKKIKNNEEINQVITNFKPPIFWKDKEIVKTQILNWSLTNLEDMIFNINETELLIKKNSSNSLNILSDFIISHSKNTNI